MGNDFDLVIIGAGPTGLFGAFYAGFRRLKTLVIDSLEEPGGQITALYPEKYIYDVAGFPKILGKDLVKNLVEQVKPFSDIVSFSFGETVVDLKVNGERDITLKTDKGREIKTKAVVICAGIGALEPKKFGKPHIDSWEGKGLSFVVKRVKDYEGKKVLIVGGGDSAVDWALNLRGVASKITLIHRRDKFRAFPASVEEMMKSPEIEVKLFWEIKEIRGDNWVKEVVIFNNRTGEEQVLEVDAVLAFLGFSRNIGPIKNWGLEIENNAIRAVSTKMETNLPGVYVAGDIATYPGKVKLIATGFGEVATAVNNAAAFIYPSLSVFPGHSSEKGVGTGK